METTRKGGAARCEAPMPQRLANMDALRVLAMCLIVMQHTLYHGGMMAAAEQTPGNAAFYEVWFFYALASCGVDVFVLLSGYFLAKQAFRLKRIFLLAVQVFFYSAGICLILALTGRIALTPGALVENLLPLSTRQYWFLTAYFGLALLSPFLNRCLAHLNRRQHGLLCLLLVFMAGARPGAALLEDRFSTGGETGALWMICLYAVGAWFRLYYRGGAGKLRLLAGYFGCGAAVALIRFALLQSGSARNPYDFVRYHTLLIFLEALCLFALFLKVPERFRGAAAFRVLGPAALGVYLLHDNRYLRGMLWGLVQPAQWLGTPWFAAYLPLCAAAVFLCCAAVELLRARLFLPLTHSAALQNICDKIEKRLGLLL